MKWYNHLRKKGLQYWYIVLILIPLGTLAGDVLGNWGIWVSVRYSIYRVLQRISPHSLTYSTRTVVVLITDEEYWKGELARRAPLKRTYLAELLSKLDQANPAVIGLDFDLRSQTPDRSFVEHPDYDAETGVLLNCVKSVSRNRPVVLIKALYRATQTGESTSPAEEQYAAEPSVYDDFDFGGEDIPTGYVRLTEDIRQVPLALTLKDGSTVNSFAGAVARTVDKKAVQSAQESERDELPYGTFIPPENFEPLSAKFVQESSPETLKPLLCCRVVLVGGAWHTDAFGRGEQADTHLTPVGEIGGVFVHANYVEALLTHRTAGPLGKPIGVTIEVLVSIAIALIFAWNWKWWIKLIWILVLSLLLIFATYFSWQNLGLFFDFFIPLILLGGHVVIARVLEWRTDAKKYANLKSVQGTYGVT